jgi:hypothetical protein
MMLDYVFMESDIIYDRKEQHAVKVFWMYAITFRFDRSSRSECNDVSALVEARIVLAHSRPNRIAHR